MFLRDCSCAGKQVAFNLATKVGMNNTFVRALKNLKEVQGLDLLV